MDNIEVISRQSPDDELIEAAAEAVATGLLPPRFQVGLWLMLNQPEQVYAAVNNYKTQKKNFDFELLFSQEAEAFRESSKFSRLTEETGLDAYWARFGVADANR